MCSSTFPNFFFFSPSTNLSYILFFNKLRSKWPDPAEELLPQDPSPRPDRRPPLPLLELRHLLPLLLLMLLPTHLQLLPHRTLSLLLPNSLVSLPRWLPLPLALLLVLPLVTLSVLASAACLAVLLAALLPRHSKPQSLLLPPPPTILLSLKPLEHVRLMHEISLAASMRTMATCKFATGTSNN